MKYLLAATVIFWVLFALAYHSADRPGDDFGAAMPALFCGLVSVVLTVVYAAFVFWNHRFL